MQIDEEDYISHAGVPGMHWGHRKAEPVGLIPRMLGRKENFRVDVPKGMSNREFDKQYAKETADAKVRHVKIAQKLKESKEMNKAYAQMIQENQDAERAKKVKSFVASALVGLVIVGGVAISMHNDANKANALVKSRQSDKLDFGAINNALNFE